MTMTMPGTVAVIGRGRVGSALARRVAARGRLGDPATSDLVVLAVPDTAIAEVARARPVGPWVAHVSGATPLDALAPHARRLSVHPLQTFTRDRGAEQIDGAWAAVTGATGEARAVGYWFAELVGLRPFDLADDRRAMYHAGAVFASNFLVTLHRAAVRALEAAGAPPEALLPLMQRTIDNGFDLTGPIARGDWSTVGRHLAALGREAPDLEPLYRALAEATRP
jgi:predicted short-subunit dehydrogenase-like oxidoreductase (DUF2520 family)